MRFHSISIQKICPTKEHRFISLSKHIDIIISIDQLSTKPMPWTEQAAVDSLRNNTAGRVYIKCNSAIHDIMRLHTAAHVQKSQAYVLRFLAFSPALTPPDAHANNRTNREAPRRLPKRFRLRLAAYLFDAAEETLPCQQ